MFNELLAWIDDQQEYAIAMQDTINMDHPEPESEAFALHEQQIFRFSQIAARVRALQWLIAKSAIVAHSSDGDCCWVCWHEDEDEYRTDPHGDAMTAIEEGMRMTGDIVTHADIVGAESISG